MNKLNAEKAAKLQKILSKRVGRELSEVEISVAYDNLLNFASLLFEWNSQFPELDDDKSIKNSNQALVKSNDMLYGVDRGLG